MTTIRAFVKRHPLLSFYALAFAISWGGILIMVGGPGGFPGTKEQAETLMPFVLVPWLAGPSVAGVLLTGLLHGREGFRDLLARMRRWRVGARWYAVALLTAPLVFTGVLLALSLTSTKFLPSILATSDKAALLLMGIAYALVGVSLRSWAGRGSPYPG
jgi:hypothetical protein